MAAQCRALSSEKANLLIFKIQAVRSQAGTRSGRVWELWLDRVACALTSLTAETPSTLLVMLCLSKTESVEQNMGSHC